MVSKPWGIGAADKLFQAAQVLAVQRLSRAKIHGDAVLHHTIAFQYLIEHLERAAAFHHVVFRDDFKPVDDRFLFENMVVMGNSQPDSYAEVFVSVKAICGHKANKEGEWIPDFF